MLELRVIRNEMERVLEGFNKRNLPEELLALIPEIISLDDNRKASQLLVDRNLEKLNILSKEIGDLFKSGNAAEAEF